MGFATRREMYEARRTQMLATRQPYEPVWRDIGEQMAPYRLLLEPSNPMRGQIRDRLILNSRPVRSLKTLAAGMMAGITSPAREWFNFTTSDPELRKYKPVAQYLEDCQQIVAAILHSSNWYRALASGTYQDLGAFATAGLWREEGTPLQTPGLIRYRAMPMGEYAFDIDAEGRIDTCFRELQVSVRQCIQKFGLENCSPTVQQANEDGRLNDPVIIAHLVQPNEEYREGAFGPEGMRFQSCWWDRRDTRPEAFLKEWGYHEFPALSPRWEAQPGDTYGIGPGWEVRGDCRMLQHAENRWLQMVDKTVNPPMRAAPDVKKGSLLPASITRGTPGKNGGTIFEPAMEIPPQAMQVMAEHRREIEERIADGMHATLWRLFIDDDRSQRATATEIDAKRLEKMTMLGPLLENLNNELLEPAVEGVYAMLARNGMLPETPEELEGKDVKVEFISIMHQAQQSTRLIGIQTFVSEVQRMFDMFPDLVDKVDAEAIVDDLVLITGIPPKIVRSKKEVEAARRVRAEETEAAQMGQAMAVGARAAADASKADPAKLTQLLNAVAPAAAAQAGGGLGAAGAA